MPGDLTELSSIWNTNCFVCIPSHNYSPDSLHLTQISQKKIMLCLYADLLQFYLSFCK
jgi:hypothetical protein